MDAIRYYECNEYDARDQDVRFTRQNISMHERKNRISFANRRHSTYTGVPSQEPVYTINTSAAMTEIS